MNDLKSRFVALYNNFNERRIDLVISELTDEVQWANGMEGGYVFGHDGVSKYWKRQFGMVNAQVTPQEITVSGHRVQIKVHQVVPNLDGNLLTDEEVTHIFTLTGDKISKFEIEK